MAFNLLKRLAMSLVWAFAFAMATGVVAGIAIPAIDMLRSSGIAHADQAPYKVIGGLSADVSVICGCVGFVLGILGKLPGTHHPQN